MTKQPIGTEKDKKGSSALPLHVLKSAEKGLKEFALGQGISSEEFKAKYFTKKHP